MGLFGVMTDITFKVEPMVIVKTENDFSLTVEDLFYDPDCLKKLHDDNWSVEIFWFPFNSLSWLELMCLGLIYTFKGRSTQTIGKGDRDGFRGDGDRTVAIKIV